MVQVIVEHCLLPLANIHSLMYSVLCVGAGSKVLGWTVLFAVEIKVVARWAFLARHTEAVQGPLEASVRQSIKESIAVA